jgi:hypothetical protein
LKTQEKKLADERSKSQAAATPTDNQTPTAPPNEAVEDEAVEDVKKEDIAIGSSEEPAADVPQASVEVRPPMLFTSVANHHQTADDPGRLNANRDNESDAIPDMKNVETRAPAETSGNESSLPDENVDQTNPAGGMSSKNNTNGVGGEMNFNGFPNMLSMNAGVNIMDPGQMMQFMNANGMTGFNTMMGQLLHSTVNVTKLTFLSGIPNIGMNQMPQGMFGGFGGPGMGMNGMNGMNMGMNFNPNAGMYGAGWNGQNNNMWNGPQSNNPNAFSNGIGGDFGSNSGYGYNMSQSANFHQQQQPLNGDFGYYGRGPGRGRGRGRGAFNRNRNGFNNFSSASLPHFQNAHEQQQYEIQNMQAQMLNGQNDQSATNGQNIEPKTSESHQELVDDDEFAPGGQEEVQEALGADYHKSQDDESKEQDQTAEVTVLESINVPGQDDQADQADHADQAAAQADVVEETPLVDGQLDIVESACVQSPTTHKDTMDVPEKSPNARVSREEPKASMPPPSAPSGPAGQHREPEDYGFRTRVHSKYSSRTSGPLSGTNGAPMSPIKVPPQPSTASPDVKGIGVVGAPTGPRAMREPPTRPSRPLSGTLSNIGGFKIMGRASMTTQDSEPRTSRRSRSNTPVNGDGRHVSRPHSCHSGRENSRHDVDPDDYDRDRDRDHDHDRRRSRKSRKDEANDYEMQDADQHRSRSLTPSDRKSSHRNRRDKYYHTSSRRHQSSPERRQRSEINGDKNQPLDDHDVPVQSSRDNIESESRSNHRGHRSSKSSRYDDRDRDRDRDREDRHRDRKRSRHDRDREDVADDEEVSRHRSRRHKRDHRDESSTNGLGANSRSHRSSEAATPVESERERNKEKDKDKDQDKDPHTLEREARNRERMAKEMQRREKAARDDQGGGNGSGKRSAVTGRISGGRRVSYKYEEDLQSAMVETERESARWR